MKSVWRCVVCGKKIRSGSAVLMHCGKLTEWVRFDEPLVEREQKVPVVPEVERRSGMVKINVSGYIVMSESEFEKVTQADDPHYMLQLVLRMGMVDLGNLEFEVEE